MEFIASLSGTWNIVRGKYHTYTVRAADRDRHAGLTAGKTLSFGSLVHYALHGALPSDGLAYAHINGNGFDFRAENLDRQDKGDAARHALGVERSRDSGITKTPAGSYRARVFVNGQQVALGTYPTIEAARNAKQDALSHPERYPRRARAPKGSAIPALPAAQAHGVDVAAAALDQAIADTEALLERLRAQRALI